MTDSPPTPPADDPTAPRRVTPQELARINLMRKAIEACPGPDADWWPELAPLNHNERRTVCALIAQAHLPPEPEPAPEA